MAKARNTISETMGFSSSDKIAQVDKLTQAVRAEPEMIDEIELIFRKRGKEMPEFLKPESIFEMPPLVAFPFDPFEPQPAQPAPPTPAQPTPEIDTRLQFLLNAIPIAHPGNIITSEYHNALRDAVRALASRIGLNVNPAAEFNILTFAPDFKPVLKDSDRLFAWQISFHSARIPSLGDGRTESQVSGGFLVQLPDNAEIFQMIVRGEREDIGLKSPEEFRVSLKRMKFGKERRQQTLISMDLKDQQKDSRDVRYFEARESIKLSDEEADISNSRIAASAISDRKIVNNEAWLYCVTADWVGLAQGDAKFEIFSIQIICRI